VFGPHLRTAQRSFGLVPHKGGEEATNRWWEFDAPEPLNDDESEGQYLERRGCYSPVRGSGLRWPPERLRLHNQQRSM
jgi:hypothetical protein